ncbi:MAG: hypothetical protein DSY43_01875 [Gammaproteobacteria bacterium]|nr:MAG: hypothetical protein DSY43_01875 [Gammaproteobacteria bacterium]
MEQGEKSSKYFLTLEKRRQSKTHVRKLLENEKEITNPKEIIEKLKNFYSHMYSPKNEFSEDECFSFISKLNTPRLNEQEKLKCEGLLTNKECYESLKTMGNNKAPGNDGISKEFTWHSGTN